MPSRRHALLAFAVPRIRGSRELDSPVQERARIEVRHTAWGQVQPDLPSRRIRGFDKDVAVLTETVTGPAGDFPAYVLTPRGVSITRTLFYVHGGGFVAPMDRTHVVYATRLARELGARVVMPAYPLAPEHTAHDSHEALADLASRWARQGPLVLAGDSAGGGYALALAQTLRDRGGPQPSHLLLISPWVDLTTSTPETEALDSIDPWLSLSKLRSYAEWWAGSSDALRSPEASPALADLDGLPPALMFCGTRDLLVAGCRLLADRAAGSTWDLTYVEEPDLIHVYPILPLIPEAREAFRRTLEFLR
ncbi:alpha/beta hydrolase [Nocardioides psychrotolerans]|uniref:Acetyl esterase/lipase n=1 Tax=Nocardioides psychrotolerans TaxID=1005945 RepID=A0A1I3N034_9ACTN|nr:alpha/beta hydrolase [Nocardioides psychrotolerans]GEP39077.1 alpha/beta hydrolase [Nocardioides psychrotolerans]SFJ02581.1 Acetyl esterase/lipase [Nocardioides psychrotolerans]